MASAFGWSIEEVEREVVTLIQSGQIQGRVDSQNKVIIHGPQHEASLHDTSTPFIDLEGKKDGPPRRAV